MVSVYLTQCTNVPKGGKVCVIEILVSVIVIMLKFLIVHIHSMYQCKGGKVSEIEILVSVIVIMLKFSYIVHISLNVPM